MTDRTYLELIFHRLFNYETLRIGTEMEEDGYGEKVRMGKELIFSFGYAYPIPTASFLKASGKS